MRVLKIFFGFTVTILLVGLLVGLVWRELQLYTAVGQVRSLARELVSTHPNPEFSQTCLEFGGVPVSDQSLTRTQLRFVSPEEFVLEIVCQTNESLRQIVKSETLPLLVTKENGQSGLTSQQPDRGLTLTVLGRVGVVYRGDNFFQSALNYQGTPTLVFNQGPTTVCEGYGFTCCNEAYQVGQDQQQTQAWDCPRSCYATCADKPVILNFHSLPAFTAPERIVEVRSGEAVEFFYTINDISGDASARGLTDSTTQQSAGLLSRLLVAIADLFGRPNGGDALKTISIDFGDGQTGELSGLQGTATHTYNCDQRLCVYNAVIQAVTQDGRTSGLDQQSSIQVEVQGP